jgi:hypothetical protein
LDKPVIAFDETCRFIAQLADGRIASIEADRGTTVTVNDKTMKLSAYAPNDRFR